MTTSEPTMIVIGECFACHVTFSFCDECVTSVRVDPETNQPPDVTAQATPCTPDPAAVARAVRCPVCESCTERANARRSAGDQVETESQRHARHIGRATDGQS